MENLIVSRLMRLIAPLNLDAKLEILSRLSESLKAEFHPKKDDKKELLDDSQLVFGWTEKKLIYENAKITEIFKDLSRWYGVEFEVIKSLDYSKRISGRYDNPSLIDVMKSLSFAYEFEFLMDEKRIIIR